MILIAVRHGQTPANLKDLLNGRNDGDLTEQGVLQARALREQLAGEPIAAVYSSPLRRAIHTAEELLPGRKILPDARLIEREYGTYTLKKPDETVNMKALYSMKITEPIGGQVEPFRDLYARTVDFAEDMRRRYPDQTVLAVTHGDLVFALQRWLFPDERLPYPQNCACVRFEIK